jgi:hypothetical protein
MAKDTKKYGQILGEYKAILLAAQELNKLDLLSSKNLARIQNEYNQQHQHYVNINADMVGIDKYMKKMKKVFQATSQDIVTYVNSKSPKIGVDLINMSKSGLANVNTVKSDLDIVIDNQTVHVSLKQYEKNSSIQLCSGTYLSTVCSLSFERIGNGKFKDSNGTEFVSKNIQDVKKVFAKHYGERASVLVQQIKDLDNMYCHFRTTDIYPGDATWLSTTKKVGLKAVKLIADLINIVVTSSSSLKENILHRTGLTGDHDILVTADCKNPKVYSTLTDSCFKNKVTSLSHPNTKIVVGTKGQSVQFSFINGTNTITSLLMPCTINKNGAWHIPKDGVTEKYCNKSKLWIKPNHLRPEKAKEMYTSTNFYFNIKKL